jgi:hypothetical protein
LHELSLISFKDKKLVEIFNSEIINQEKYQYQKFMENKIKVVSSYEKCLVCKKEHYIDDEGKMVKFQIHHLQYHPQIVSFVHSDCHLKIHDPENPIQEYIMYQEGDSKKFYQNYNQKTLGEFK